MSAQAQAQPATRTISLDEVNAAVAAFVQSGTPQALATLQSLRRDLAFGALNYPGDLGAAWQQAFRQIHLALKGSGVRAMGRGPQEEQALQAACAALGAGWENAAQGARAAIGAMLLAYAHEVPPPRSLIAAPAWLRADFASWLLEPPPMFMREGEAELYVSRLEQTFALFHREIGEATAAPQIELLNVFLREANLIQAYFTERNLKELLRLRGDLIALGVGSRGPCALPPPAEKRGRPRLGVYVNQLSAHTETYFALATIDGVDRERFEVILYTSRQTGHALERLAVSRCDRISPLPGTLNAQVDAVRADDLDLLIVFTNMTAIMNNATLLGAHRLARVQVAAESSPVTTGLHTVDALLTCEWNAPWSDAQEHYTEHLYRMPGSNNVYAYQYDADKASIQPTRQAMGVGEHQVMFFSGANFYKLLPEVTATWARILSQVPDSVLVLMPFNPNWSNQYLSGPFQARIMQQLGQLGVDASRLRIVTPVPTRGDLNRIIALADVYLDSYPFSGACSLIDTLEAGVPPVARQGHTGRAGHAAALLRQIGLERLATDSAESYISLAVRLGRDAQLRKEEAARLKTAIAASSPPPYCDTRPYARKVCDALADLHGRHAKHYASLAALDADALCAAVGALVRDKGPYEAGLAAFNDEAITARLLAPYFRSLPPEKRERVMLDVGACFGQMSAPFLQAGWRAHLFEPDPESRAQLEKNVAPYGERARVVAAAITDREASTLSFHKASTRGLSGLSASPYGTTAEVIEVPARRLDAYCREAGLAQIDLLKIDAEGHDFEALRSLDFDSIAPRVVMLEFGTSFAGQTVAELNRLRAEMAARGYRSLLFGFEDDSAMHSGIFSYRLSRILLDRPCPEGLAQFFGNALFFRADDKRFLLALHSLLDGARPNRSFLPRRSGPENSP